MGFTGRLVKALAATISLAAAVHGDAHLSTIAGTLVAEGGFKTLVAAATQAGLVGALNDPNSTLTLLAPTDAAFDKISAVVPFLLVDNDYTKKILSDVLLYHVLPEALSAVGRKPEINGERATLLGEPLSIKAPKINGGAATITKADIMASGNLIHAIDDVLLPPNAPLLTLADVAVAAGLNSLVAALTGVGAIELFSTAGEVYTVFAPNDQAFADFLGSTDLETVLGDPVLKELLMDVLELHFVAGSVLDSTAVVASNKIKTAGRKISAKAYIIPNLVAVDQFAVNGIAHVVNKLIITPKLEMMIAQRLLLTNSSSH